MTRTDIAGSQQKTAVSPFLGVVSTVVAKICNASQSNVLKLQNALYQVPHFELTCAPRNALPHHVLRSARRPKCPIGVSKAKNKCGWARLFEHSTAWPVPCFKKRSVSDLKIPMVRKYTRNQKLQ